MAQLAETRVAAGGKPAAVTDGGTALTTTAGYTQLYPGTTQIDIIPRNFSTAVVVKFALNPYLVVLKATDRFATQAKVIDYSEAAQDGSASTSIDLSEMATLASGTGLYVGAHLPFRGVDIDVDGTNSAGTATLTANYSSLDGFKSLTITDGTEATRTLAQDGTVTWTVPVDWKPRTLAQLEPGFGSYSHKYKDIPMFWVRFAVSAAVTDTSVTLDHLVAMNRSTVYGALPSGVSIVGMNVTRGFGGVGCIEALTDAGTASLIVNCTADERFS